VYNPVTRLKRNHPIPLSIETNEHGFFKLANQNGWKSMSTKILLPDEEDLTGEECFRRATEAHKKVEAYKEAVEIRKSKEQFDAMSKQFERQQKAEHEMLTSPTKKMKEVKVNKHVNKNAGIALVRTMSKQNREESGTKSRNSTAKNEGEELENNSRMWLEKAAFDHMHPKALTLIGNNALEEANHTIGNSKLDVDEIIVSPGHSKIENDKLWEILSQPPLKRAIECYKLAGEKGSAEGYYNLGHVLWTGHPPVSDSDVINADDHPVSSEKMTFNENGDMLPNRKAAIDAFQRSIDLGDIDASYFLGVHFIQSESVKSISKDGNDLNDLKLSGLKMLNDAARDGHGGALYFLALLHLNGDSSIGVDACEGKEFKERLDLAASADDSDALYTRAHCFLKGTDGYKLDFSLALNGFLDSLKAGNSEAGVSAGAMYYHGGFNGAVEQNYTKAFELYQQAAEMGNIDGWRNVAACYATGNGIPKCENTAKYITKIMLKDG